MKLKYVLFIMLLSGCSSISFTKATVKVTNLTSDSGGSGSIVKVSETKSEVLTNAHVCGVVKDGGLVHTYDHKVYFVSSYRISQMHDLCLITIQANLIHAASISDWSPVKFEESTVAGHPRLLPTILTKGFFSDRLIVKIMSGVRDCQEEDKNDPDTAFFCSMFGKVPVIKTYETMVVSSLIQPGSSGSAVYGSAGKISAVIFAGSGDLGYGLAVPHEYVYNFLEYESKLLPDVIPDNEMISNRRSHPEKTKQFLKDFEKYCNENKLKDNNTQRICNLFEEVSQYDDLIEYNEN